MSKNATICADLLHAHVYKDDPWWGGGYRWDLGTEITWG